MCPAPAQGDYGFPSTSEVVAGRAPHFSGVLIVTVKVCWQTCSQGKVGVRPRGEDAQPQEAAGQASKQGLHSPLVVSVLGW